MQFQVCPNPEESQSSPCCETLEDAEKVEKPVVFEAWIDKGEHFNSQSVEDSEIVLRHQDEFGDEAGTHTPDNTSTNEVVKG